MIICKAFPLTLGCMEMTWSTGMKLGLISSLSQLEDSFVAPFTGACSIKTTCLFVFSCSKGESNLEILGLKVHRSDYASKRLH